jgi:hypothetical protein
MSAISRTQPSRGAQFAIILHNAGDADLVINLGHMLANGKVMVPSAVRLHIIDPGGNARELLFFDRRYPGVAGRIDDFTVALRRGAMYVLPISLDDYWSPATQESELTLAVGRHRVSAQLEGKGATALNSDMQGIALMNFWKGNVESDLLEFEVH